MYKKPKASQLKTNKPIIVITTIMLVIFSVSSEEKKGM